MKSVARLFDPDLTPSARMLAEMKENKVLEVSLQGLWSQVLILANKDIEHTVRVYNPPLEN